MFPVGITLGLRLTSLVELTIDKLYQTTIDDYAVIIYGEKISSRFFEAKNRSAGLQAIKTKPVVIFIFNFQCLEGAVNLHNIINDHIKLLRQLVDFSMRFFVSINKFATDKKSFFMSSNLGKMRFQI